MSWGYFEMALSQRKHCWPLEWIADILWHCVTVLSHGMFTLLTSGIKVPYNEGGQSPVASMMSWVLSFSMKKFAYFLSPRETHELRALCLVKNVLKFMRGNLRTPPKNFCFMQGWSREGGFWRCREKMEEPQTKFVQWPPSGMWCQWSWHLLEQSGMLSCDW